MTWAIQPDGRNRNEWRWLFLYLVGWVVIYGDRAALYPLIPVLGRVFSLSNTRKGLLMSAYFLPYVCAQVPAGMAGDRLGRPRVLLVSLGVTAAGILVVTLVARSYLLLAAGLMLHGLGAGAFYPLSYGAALEGAPEGARGLVSATINAGMCLGLVAGEVVPPWLVSRFGSWRLAFLPFASASVALFVAFALRLRPAWRQRVHRPRATSAGPDPALVRILLDRDYGSLCVANFCSMYGFWTVLTWAPSVFVSEKGFGLVASGTYASLIAVSSLVSGLLMGYLSDRLGRRPVSLVLFPVAAAAILGILLAGVPWALATWLVVYGLAGKLVWDGVGVSWVSDVAAARGDRSLGGILGVFSISGMSSAVVAPSLTGFLKDATGSFTAAFVVSAALLALGTVVLAVGPRRRRCALGPQRA